MVQLDIVEAVKLEECASDVIEEIIFYQRICSPAGSGRGVTLAERRSDLIIVAKEVKCPFGVFDYVVREGYVFHGRPRRTTFLIAHREENGLSILRIGPVVFKYIAVDDYVPRVLQLQYVLYCPVLACIGGMTNLPGQWLEHVIAPDLDV